MRARGYILIEDMIDMIIIGIVAGTIVLILRDDRPYDFVSTRPDTAEVDRFKCVDGYLQTQHGEPVVQNGFAVKC